MDQKDYILTSVKQEFSYQPYLRPSQSRVYIFYLIKSGLILYMDTPVCTLTLNSLIEDQIIKYEPGVYYHQCELAIRYRFSGYKYPSEYYRTASIKLKEQVFSNDNYRCTHCGSTKHLTIDHIVPWSHGGYTESHNLQTLCKTCNSIKHNN